jgi:hypothetical protein
MSQYCPILHQPRVSELGPSIWIHMASKLCHRCSLGLFLPSRSQRQDSRADHRDGRFDGTWWGQTLTLPQFEAHVPARKFRKYECVGVIPVAEDKLSRKSLEEQVWENEKAGKSLQERRCSITDVYR